LRNDTVFIQDVSIDSVMTCNQYRIPVLTIDRDRQEAADHVQVFVLRSSL
jgi:hypothetical protein